MKTRSFGSRVSRALLVVALCHLELVADGPQLQFTHLPSRQQVFGFLVETIDWYRRLSLDQEITTGPTDLLFLEENRTIAAQIVRFSFEFAKAATGFEGTGQAEGSTAAGPTTSHAEFQHLAAMVAKSEAETEETSSALRLLKQKVLTIRSADRKKVEAEIAETQSRLELLRTRSDRFGNLLAFIRSTDLALGDTGDLQSFVTELERSVPEVSPTFGSPLAVTRQMTTPPSVVTRSSSGILGEFSEVSSLARKLRELDQLIRLTDEVAQSSQNLRTPLVVPLNDILQSPALAQNGQSLSLQELQQQTNRLEALRLQAERISPAVSALGKQEVLFALFKTHLAARRTSLLSQSHAAWWNLIWRLSILAGTIALLACAAVVLRRLTARHIHQANNRRMVLIVQRAFFWLATVLAVFFAFAFNLSSLATFLGLLSAGVAVALQNVILAVVGYFVIVGKLGLRVGDRVKFSGVTGDVIEIGLMQFQLQELEGPDSRPSGRLVSFANSFVFVSPATGFFKFVHDASSLSK